MRSTLVVALLVGAAALANAQPIKRANNPALSPDGQSLAFSYQDDLWVVPAAGGEARRITVNPASDTTPRWLPDGKTIVFTSNRHGSLDLFSVQSDGTGLKRLNMDGSNEYLTSVAADGKTLLGYTTAWGRINVFAMPVQGGELIQLTGHPLELAFFPYPSPDGQRVAYCIGGAPGSWRNPLESGSDSSEIFVGRLGAPIRNNVKLTKNDFNDTHPMITPDGSIIFISNRSGSPQLWSMNMDGAGAKQVTRHPEGTLRWPSISAQGHVVYEFDSDIYVWDKTRRESRKIDIFVPEDRLINPILRQNLSTGATRFSVSPDGKRGAVAVRGDLFLIPARGGTTRRITTSLAVDSDPIWIGNDRLLFVSGRTGKRELFTVDIQGNEKPFASHELDLTNPVLSPDGITIAVHVGDRQIAVIPSAGGELRKVAEGSFPGTYAGGPSFSWSPDNQWIIFERATERGGTLTLANIEKGTQTDLLPVAYGPGRPLFSNDGKSVFFDSQFGTEFGVRRLDLVSPDTTFTEDDLDKIDAPKPKEEAPLVRIEMRGLHRRVSTVAEGSNLVAIHPDGRNIVVSTAGQLGTVSNSGGTPSPIAGAVGVSSVQFEGAARAHIAAAGRAWTLNLANGALAPVPFSAEIVVDRRAEEVELFKEIWWAMDRMYHDPSHHGRNWKGIREEYAKLIPFAYDRQDFYSIMNEMIEELDSSHLSIGRPLPDFATERETIAYLGIDWDYDLLWKTGRYVVKSVMPGSPADHPSIRLVPGDEVLKVNGRDLKPSEPLSQHLIGLVGRRVALTVRRGGQDLTLNLRGASSVIAADLAYEQFVEQRREEVSRLSNGKLTYFHIEGMNQPATDRFFAESRAFGEGKSGAVVDVRWNGGGNTANQILDSIRTEKWLERRFRSNPGFPVSEEMFRGEALEMPTVIMTNQYSASNAEIFSEGYRRMKLGTVVGEPTGGNVLTVAGRYGLWDGGGVQIPFISIFTVNGESLEGIGRRVDVDVRYDPNAWLDGRDNQLEVAVRELLKRVK